MRKAFTLVEMLLVIATIPVFMIVMSRLFNTLLRETPRIWNSVQQNTTMLDMLSQLQSDIDRAKDLPQSKGDFTSDDKILLIEHEDSLIGYELDNEQVIRRILSSTNGNAGEERTWKMPDAKIGWNIHRKDGKGYCLEIVNYIEYKSSGRLEKKMPNSHLYFTGAM